MKVGVEAWWGGARGGGGLAEPGSCHGWSVRGRHQLQPLPPQKALEVIQTIYAERTDFPCQTYPPGTGWAELAANGLNVDYLEAVPDEDKYKAKYSAYTARLCQQHVETCHVAVSARANGATPPAAPGLCATPTAAADVAAVCLPARWPVSLLIAASVAIGALNVVCYAGCLLLCCREWWCQNPKLKRFQYF